MSMWDEEVESYPPDDRQQYRDPYASHSGSSNNHHEAHRSYSDHNHHHHGHASHNHDQHQHHGHDNGQSYHGQRSAGASPSHRNREARHESYGDREAQQHYGRQGYEGGEDEGRVSHGSRDASDDHQGHSHSAYRNSDGRAHQAPVSTSTHHQGHEGYDSNGGIEIRHEHNSPPLPTAGHGHEATNRTDLFTSDSVVNLTLDEIDALARTHRSRAWLVVLYAPWCRFCLVGRFQADGDYKEYAKRYLQLEHFPTVLFFPRDSSNIVKYHSENREVDALLGFVQSFE